MAKSEVPKAKEHPLLKKRPTEAPSWDYWKECWEKAGSEPELIGLLHWGFEARASYWTKPNQEIERLLFFLEIANQHKRTCTFHEANVEEFGRRRKRIAEKALSILCQRFFNGLRWEEYLRHEGVIEKLIWFFENDNLPVEEDHNREILMKFLQGFLDLAWSHWNPRFRRERLTNERLEELKPLRPRIIAIMVGCGFLDIAHQGFDRLTRQDLAVLRSIALSEGCRTIDQALLGHGSPRYAAQYFLVFERKFRALKKQREIERMKARIEANKRELQRLGVKTGAN